MSWGVPSSRFIIASVSGGWEDDSAFPCRLRSTGRISAFKVSNREISGARVYPVGWFAWFRIFFCGAVVPFCLDAEQAAFLAANLAAVGEQAVPDHLFRIGGKFGMPGVVRGGGQAEPDAAFLEQVIVFETAGTGIYIDAVPQDPVDDGKMLLDHSSLVVR